MTPILVALWAVVRRVAIVLGAGVLTYLGGAWPEALKKALESNADTVAWIPFVWAVIEFVQKWLRERKKAN